MTTSLTSGIPSRDTWVNPPPAVCRCVSDQMPMVGCVGASCLEGTCSATVCTLYPCSVSWPTSDRFPPYSRSKTRRSRKNGSSAWPATTCPPLRSDRAPVDPPDQGQVIGLSEVEVGVVQASHRAGVVEERVLALVVVLEGPAVGEVGL